MAKVDRMVVGVEGGRAMRTSERIALRRAASELVVVARAERALLDTCDPERHFLLGVDAAAQEILHPEVGSTRTDDWLERQDGPFRDGYVRTKALLTTAASSRGASFHLPLPRMMSRSASRQDATFERGDSNASQSR